MSFTKRPQILLMKAFDNLETISTDEQYAFAFFVCLFICLFVFCLFFAYCLNFLKSSLAKLKQN